MDFEAPPMTAKMVPRLVVDKAAPMMKVSTAPKPNPRWRGMYVWEANGEDNSCGGSEHAEGKVLLQEIHSCGKAAFEDDEDEAHIADGQEGLLPVVLQDVGEWCAVDDSNGDGTDDSGADDDCGHALC
jgi:hypothetical protein